MKPQAFSLCVLLVAGIVAAAEPPKEIAPHFQPPKELAGDFGNYKTLLKFDDGTPLKTAADWQKRRQEILKTWHGYMGEWPDLIAAPKIEYLKKEPRENFTQCHVKIEVAPGKLTDDAYLLIPDGKGPFPAVLVVYYDGLTGIGQGKGPLRDFAYQLAKRGFVTLSLGSPPASYYPTKESCKLQPLSYHAYVAANCYNLLASLPQVDAKRIGVIGHSYGGKWSMFAGALDDRFACVVTSDPGIVFDEKRSNVNYWEPWYIGFEPGVERKRGIPKADNPRTGPYKVMMEKGHDLHELMALIAPRPFLVSGGAEDQPERWKPLNRVIEVNNLLGQKQRGDDQSADAWANRGVERAGLRVFRVFLEVACLAGRLRAGTARSRPRPYTARSLFQIIMRSLRNAHIDQSYLIAPTRQGSCSSPWADSPWSCERFMKTIDSVMALADEIRPLLETAQSGELPRLAESARGEPRALAQELVRRGWLTEHQVQMLLQGRGGSLRLGPYLILDRLGEGGTGQVFKARHQQLRRLVALKVIRPELLRDAEVVARFHREIEVASRLTHPNVVLAYDAGVIDSTCFLAMEYVDGIDLDRLVKQSGPLPVAQACDLIRQAALGLQHAAERGLVHRDVKPSNLILTQPAADSAATQIMTASRWGLVKLLDLGLARLQQRPDGPKARVLTTIGSMLGTTDYLAPEQALDFHRADTRSDIYSLGCTMYHLLAGQPPFAGRSMAQKLMCHQNKETPPLPRSDVPAAVTAVLARMVAKKPDDRYQTPAAVVEDLHAHCGPPRSAVIQGRATRTVWSKRPWRRGLALAGCLLLVTVGGWRAVVGLHGDTPAPATSRPKLAAALTPQARPASMASVVVLAQSTPGWRFMPEPSVPGDVRWMLPDFDDQAWPRGQTPIGYGEREIDTRNGVTVKVRGVPFLFRREFDVPADLLGRPGVAFRLQVASDDSATVYLNGDVVDADPIKSHEYKYWNRSILLSAGPFRPGRNVIAARVHNSASSSDIYLDLEIVAE